jgi:hypothetical protein
MRTTLTLDDPLAKELKKLALETGQPFKKVVNETLRAGLRRPNAAPLRAYHLTPVAMGMPKPGVDLGNALQLDNQLAPDHCAHIAVLALERGCTICSTDSDFKRFPGVVHINPLADVRR